MRGPDRWLMVELDDASQIGAARRSAARLAEYAELDEVAAGHVALITVELATNLLKHSVRGRLFLRPELGGGAAAIDIVAIDHGPGMDLARCFDDGFSTSGTSGTGLGAVRRAANLFDAYSDARGSVLFARVGDVGGPRRGGISVPVKGEAQSGDEWQYLDTADGWSVAVVDGLGHGPGAAAASAVVIDVHRDTSADPARCLALAHERSRSTRGSACSVVTFDATRGVLVHAGIGNVAVTVIDAAGSQGLASQNGTLGSVIQSVRGNQVPIASRSLVVLHSDGLSARWQIDAYPGLRLRHPQVVAGVLFRDAQRPRDDATVFVIEAGGGHGR